MAAFELVEQAADGGSQALPESGALGSDILVHNVHWFMKVRWIVAALLLVVGLAGVIVPGWARGLELRIPSEWLLLLAAGLSIANVAFALAARRLTEDRHRPEARIHLWLQIAVDLIAVTLLVHAIGSEQTFISFIYLFHISLACIFFPKRESVLVTAATAFLFLAVVALELSAIWPSPGIFLSVEAAAGARGASFAVLTAASAVFIWFMVWYLVSTLSEVVRRRDLKLDRMNEELLRLDREKNMQMLLTTHELKVPFAGIQSNIEVLKIQHWSSISDEVRAILERIDLRAQLLSGRIGEMLYLGRLKSMEPSLEPLVPLNLGQAVSNVLKNLEQKAEDRRIVFSVSVPALVVPGNVEHFGILLTNIVSNAIQYSHEGATVEITAREEEAAVIVAVSDHGIGIRQEALPRIFEEFYRTKEAARFNKMSSGLGLAIVREVARHFGLRVRVTSEEGTGTTFEVTFPTKRPERGRE